MISVSVGAEAFLSAANAETAEAGREGEGERGGGEEGGEFHKDGVTGINPGDEKSRGKLSEKFLAGFCAGRVIACEPISMLKTRLKPRARRCHVPENSRTQRTLGALLFYERTAFEGTERFFVPHVGRLARGAGAHAGVSRGGVGAHRRGQGDAAVGGLCAAECGGGRGSVGARGVRWAGWSGRNRRRRKADAASARLAAAYVQGLDARAMVGR
jgi:hypothetical protein